MRFAVSLACLSTLFASASVFADFDYNVSASMDWMNLSVELELHGGGSSSLSPTPTNSSVYTEYSNAFLLMPSVMQDSASDWQPIDVVDFISFDGLPAPTSANFFEIAASSSNTELITSTEQIFPGAQGSDFEGGYGRARAFREGTFSIANNGILRISIPITIEAVTSDPSVQITATASLDASRFNNALLAAGASASAQANLSTGPISDTRVLSFIMQVFAGDTINFDAETAIDIQVITPVAPIPTPIPAGIWLLLSALPVFHIKRQLGQRVGGNK